MTESSETLPAGSDPEPPKGSGATRWLAIAAIFVIAIGVLLILTSRGAEPVDTRAATLVAPPPEVGAASVPGTYVRVSPPVDLGTAERVAKAASLGRIPLPDSRELASFRRTDTGEEITHAVLIYDDESEAATLDGLAAPLLESALGLEWQPLDLPGAEDARLWSGKGYHIVTFRTGGVVQLVATTAPDASTAVDLAALARDRAAGVGSVTAPAGDG